MTQLASGAAHQCMEHQDEDTACLEVVDQPFQPQAMKIGDMHNGIAYCRKAQCPRGPSTSGQDEDW
jgi:hypothetical protein